MIYLFFVLFMMFIVLNVINIKKRDKNRMITRSENEKYLNSLSDEEKLRKLKHQLKFREESINRWPDDKEFRDKNFEIYGKETNPHQDIEKAAIERVKKEIEEIERRIKK